MAIYTTDHLSAAVGKDAKACRRALRAIRAAGGNIGIQRTATDKGKDYIWASDRTFQIAVHAVRRFYGMTD